jgi:hypothetical protein
VMRAKGIGPTLFLAIVLPPGVSPEECERHGS